jgi:hypothetical protein
MKKKAQNQGFQALLGFEVWALYLGGCAPWRPADTAYAVTGVDSSGSTLTVTLTGGYAGNEVAKLVVVEPGPLEKNSDGRFVIRKARAVSFDGHPYSLEAEDAVLFA